MALDREGYAQYVAGLNQEQEEADEAAEKEKNKSFLEKAKDTIENVSNTVESNLQNASQYPTAADQETPDTGGSLLDFAVNTASDVSTAFQNANKSYHDYLDEGARLQQAFSPENVAQANESGDYSTQDQAVSDLRESASTLSKARTEFAWSPLKEGTRELISAYADDDNSSMQSLAQNLRRSSANVEYFMSPEEKIAKAREMEDITGINAASILADNDTYKNALEIYDYTMKQKSLVPNGEFSMDKVWDEFPGLKSLASMDPQSAALALHDIKSVRRTSGIIDTFSKMLEYGNEKLEYDNLQYKIMTGKADDNDRQRAQDLKKMLQEEVSLPSFLDEPLTYVAAGIAGSAPEMWQGTVNMLHDAAEGALAGALAGAAIGMAGTPVGSLAGGTLGGLGGAFAGMARGYAIRQMAIQGAKVMAPRMARYGMFAGMYVPETGDRYGQYTALKDKDGNPLLTPDEAKDYARVGGALNAGIEMANFGTVTSALKGSPHAAEVVNSIIGRAQMEASAKHEMKNLLADNAGTIMKVTAQETSEEGLQSISDDLIHNRIEINTGDSNPENGGIYSAQTMAGNALMAMGQALPGSLGFGLASAAGGLPGGAFKFGTRMKHLTEFQTKYDEDTRTTMTGTIMMEQLQQVVADSKLQHTAPDVQEKLMRDQLSGTKFENVWVDTEAALEKEHGREDLESFAQAAGYSQEELDTAIQEKGTLMAPAEKLAMAKTSAEFLQAVSYDADAEPMAKMAKTAQATIAEVKKQEQAAVEQQIKLTEIVTKELFPKDEAGKGMAQAAIYTNPMNPAAGWNELYKNTVAEKMAIIGPALETLKNGMGNGVDIVLGENGKGTRVSNNDEWYRKFYAAYGRAPKAQELEDMAAAMATGDPSAPKVAGWIPTTAEEQQQLAANKEDLDRINENLKTMERIKNRMREMNGVEMELTQGLTAEGFSAYRNVYADLQTAGGVPSRAARMDAILFARHADIFADIMTRKSGKKYTAMDYYHERYELDLTGKYKQNGINQAAMYLHPAKNFKEFKDKVLSGEAKKSYFDKIYTDGAVLRVYSDDIKHIQTGKHSHPLSDKEWEIFMDNLDNIQEAIQTDGIKKPRGKAIIVKIHHEDTYYGGLMEFHPSGIVFLKTAVAGSENKVDGILKIKKREAGMRIHTGLPGRTAETGGSHAAITSHSLSISSIQQALGIDKPEKSSLYQKAWHGSPHDFQTFDLGSAFSGSGKAIHGWGLYFTKDKKAAQRYKKILGSTGRLYQVDIPDKKDLLDEDALYKEQPKNIKDGVLAAYDAMDDEQKNTFADALIKKQQHSKEYITANGQLKVIEASVRALEKMSSGNKMNGIIIRMMEKNLRNAGFSDEQIKEIESNKEKAGQVKKEYEKRMAEQKKDLVEKISIIQTNMDAADEQAKNNVMQTIDSPSSIVTGKEIYNALVRAMNNDIRQASLALNVQGIKGISYQGGPDGQCFVVFDDKAVSVIEKYNQMAGVMAGTADRLALNTAQQMQADRKNLDEIWKETGWTKGRDGMWRFEIPDNLSSINLSGLNEEWRPLSALYDNEKLYEAYPFLRDIQVRAVELPPEEKGNSTSEQIELNKRNIRNTPKNKSILIHEIQHIIQSIEDFAAGGNPESVRRRVVRETEKLKKIMKSVPGGLEYLNAKNNFEHAMLYGDSSNDKIETYRQAYQKAKASLSEKDRKNLDDWDQNAENMDRQLAAENNHGLYEKLAGEQEARMTAQRAMEGNPAELLEQEIRQEQSAKMTLENEIAKVPAKTQAAVRNLIQQDYLHKGWPDAETKSNMMNIVGNMDRSLMNAVLSYMQHKDNVDHLQRGSVTRPIPHDNQAIISFGHYEMSLRNPETIYRGQINKESDGRRIISLFEHADESTFMHEMSHMFLMDLEDLSHIDDISAKQLDIVNDWAAWKKGAAEEYKGTPWGKEFVLREKNILAAEEAEDVDQADELKRQWRQERFARAFELYLKNGTAPARGLKAVFRTFKKWLRAIYIGFVGDGGRATKSVEAIMARMIAAEQEIEAAELDERYRDITKAGGEKLLNESETDTYRRWHTEAMNEAKEKLMAIVMKDLEEKGRADMQKRIDAEREKKRVELENNPAYLAEAAAKSLGDERIVMQWFDSIDSYHAARDEMPSLEDALNDYMEKYADALDKELIQSHLTEENVALAMEHPVYHKKLIEMEASAFAERERLVNRIDFKTRNAMRTVMEKIEALPENTDLTIDKEDQRVKDVMKEINRLRFSSRWSARDMGRIESMMRSATREDLDEAMKKFKEEAGQQEVNKKLLDETNKGMMQTYTAMAKRAIMAKPLHEACDYQGYRRNEKLSAKRAEQMAAAGRWQLAMKAKQAQALSAAMAAEAKKMQEYVNKIIHKVEKQLKARSIKLPKDERYWHKHLAYILRITDKDADKPEGGPAKLEDMFKILVDSLDMEYTPMDILTIAQDENFKGYRTLSIGQFEDAVETLTILYTTGRDKYKMKSIAGKDIADVIDEILTDDTGYNNVSVEQRKVEDDTGGTGYSEWLAKAPIVGKWAATKNQQALAALMKPEEMLKMLGKSAHRYIYGIYEKAAEKEGEMRAQGVKELKDILSVYKHAERRAWKDRVYTLRTEYGEEKISKENIMCMALNLGNEINTSRLCLGLGIDETAVQKFVRENMTRRDWETVQKLWDYINQYWPDTVKVEEQLNGVTLKKQEPRAFTVETADGELELQGGYFPIAYNPRKNARASDQSVDEAARRSMSGAQVLGTGRGFTRARSELEISRPLLLEFNVVTSHVDNVVHNIAYRIAARDVYRLVNDNRFSQHVVSTMGRPFYDALREWSVDTWRILPNGTNMTEDFVNAGLAALRRNSVMAIMGYRVWPVIENFSNIAPVMDQIGIYQGLAAVGDYYKHIRVYKQLLHKSVFMANRINEMDRDIRARTDLFEAKSRPLEIIQDHAYTMMLKSDLMFSAPLWCRAYKNSWLGNLEEVTQENERNRQAFANAQEKFKDLKGKLHDLYSRKKSINDELEYTRTTESPFAVWSDEDLRAEKDNISSQAKDLKHELFLAEASLDKLSEIQLMTEKEINDEAERRSIMAADQAVRETFGSGRAQDLASVQRSKSEMVKLTTTFYSFFNTQFNALLSAYLKSKNTEAVSSWQHIIKWAPFAKATLYRLIFMSFIGSMLKMLTGTDGSDDKDKHKKVKGPDGKETTIDVSRNERFMKVWAKNMLSTATGSIILLRDAANMAINLIFDGTDYGRGFNPWSTGLKGLGEAGTAIKLLCTMSEKNLEIEEKHAREREKYQKMSKKARKTWDANQKYRKPDHKITYTEIAKHAANSASTFFAADKGLPTNTLMDSIFTTMQYLNDNDSRYDPTMKNIIWSAVFDKKPVEREIPKKPPAPPKKKKKK